MIYFLNNQYNILIINRTQKLIVLNNLSGLSEGINIKDLFSYLWEIADR